MRRPKYRFKIGQVVEIERVRHRFSKAWPASDDENDRRSEPEYLFLRERDDSPYPIREPDLDRFVFDRVFKTLSEAQAKCRNVRIGPDGPKDELAPVRKFWCERYDESPVPHSKVSLERFIQKILDEWGSRPEFPKNFTPKCWTLRGWVKTRGIPGDRPISVMDRRDPEPQEITDAEKKILNWAVAWFWSLRGRDRMDAHAKIVRVTSFLNRRAKKKNPQVSPLVIPHYSTTCRHITDAENQTTWAAKNNERVAYQRFHGVQEGLSATRLLESVVIDGTPGDEFLVIDERTLEPVGRPYVMFSVCVKTRALLAVNVTYEDPSLYTAMAVLKRTVLPKLDLIEARPDLAVTLSPFGKPGTVYMDRAWENVGKSTQDALEDAHIDVTWAPIENGEYKAIGERAIGTFNRKVFHKAPGGIPYPPYILRKLKIDPANTTVHTLATLEERILDGIDDYHRQHHDGLGKIAPIEMWIRESQIHGIETLSDPDFLDSAFAEVFDVSITREGVFLEDVHYHDELATTLLMDRLAPISPGHGRRRSTIRARAKAKRNPGDLTVLHVWNHRDQDYVRLPAVDAYHLLGLNRQQMIFIKNFADAEELPFNTDADRAHARLRLVEKLERDMPGVSIAAKRKQRQLLAPPSRSVTGTSIRIQTIAPSHNGQNDLQVPTSYGRRAGDGRPTKGIRRGGKAATAKSKRTHEKNSWAKRTAEEALARAQQTNRLDGPRADAPVTPHNGKKPASTSDRAGVTTKTAFALPGDAEEFLRQLQKKGWGNVSIAKKNQDKAI